MATFAPNGGSGKDDFKFIKNPFSDSERHVFTPLNYNGNYRYWDNSLPTYIVGNTTNGYKVYSNLRIVKNLSNYKKTPVCCDEQLKYDIPDIAESIVCEVKSFSASDTSGPEYGNNPDSNYYCYKVTLHPVKIYNMETGLVEKTIGKDVIPSNYTLFPVDYSGSGSHGYYTKGQYSGYCCCLLLKDAITNISGCWYVPVLIGRNKASGTGNIPYTIVQMYKIDPSQTDVNEQVKKIYEQQIEYLSTDVSGTAFDLTAAPDALFKQYGAYVLDNKIYIYVNLKELRPNYNVEIIDVGHGDFEMCFNTSNNSLIIYKYPKKPSGHEGFYTITVQTYGAQINYKISDGKYATTMGSDTEILKSGDESVFIYGNKGFVNIDVASDGTTPFFIFENDLKYNQKYYIRKSYKYANDTSMIYNFDGVNAFYEVGNASFDEWVIIKQNLKGIPT